MLVKKNLKKGFTLVELLVTISIFVILTGVVLFSQSRFNGSILLTNLAYDTALTIRQAQTYGINVKEFNTGSGAADASKFVPYGVHFDTANGKSFILYADIASVPKNKFNGETFSNCITAEGCVSRYNIKQGNFIKAICEASLSASDKACPNGTDRSSLDVTFQRPNPDAHLIFNSDTVESAVGVATVILASPDNSTRNVRVWSSGLIEVIN